MANGDHVALQRIWAQVADNPRQALEESLAPTDLQSLLLAVMRQRAAAVTPSRLMRRWREDAFVRPATVDPRALSRIEAQLWQLLPDEFIGVELSPVVPLGACSAIAPVHQNRVLATARHTEVLSDPTNALAIEAAWRIRDGDASVHLAASHRVFRLQRFPPPLSQHFHLFALVSAAKATGSGMTEAAMLINHLNYWITALTTILPNERLQIALSAFDPVPMQDRLRDTVLPALTPSPRAVVSEDPTRQRARGYYVGAAQRINVVSESGEQEIGDGGLTTWTAQLLDDAKQRCLISCIALERLAG